MGLAYPQAIRIIVDEVLGARDEAMIDRAAIGMFFIFALQGVVGALRYYLFTVAGERVVADLRGRLFERIVAQEIGFFDERLTGELTSRLSSDASVVQNAVSVNISMALRSSGVNGSSEPSTFLLSACSTASGRSCRAPPPPSSAEVPPAAGSAVDDNAELAAEALRTLAIWSA